MKSATMHTHAPSHTNIPYPNAATRRQVLEKMLDRLLLIASCIGLATMLLFLLSLA
jgi:hypothetical protein